MRARFTAQSLPDPRCCAKMARVRAQFASTSPQSPVEGQDLLHRCDDIVGGR